MQSEPAGGLRGFLRSKLGRVAYILLAIGIVFATFAYVSTVLAIPVMLIVGLALPVYAGLKRGRFLALSALVVLVAVAPLATVVFSQELLTPPGAVSSPGTGPFETGGSVLQNATISPFSGGSGTNFTWTVLLFPKFLNGFLNGTNWLNDSMVLFVSNCPGATTPNVSYCGGGGYTLITLSHPFASATTPPNGTVVQFRQAISPNTIWSWQIQLVIQNLSNASNPTRIGLNGDPTYNGIEGPIVGGFSTAYAALIVTIFELDLVYLGIPFYFVLLLYLWFKSREARHKQLLRQAAQSSLAAARPAGAPSSPKPSVGAPAPAGSAPAPGAPSSELACPNCAAVVYPNEAKCWKCGAVLPGGGSTPLQSGN